jgi:hypothetical protein
MKKKPAKQRNAAAMALHQLRRSGAMGAHTKTKKALRRQNKVQLRKQLD